MVHSTSSVIFSGLENILKKDSTKSNFQRNALKAFMNHPLVKEFGAKLTFKTKKTINSRNTSTSYHGWKKIVEQVKDLDRKLEFLRLLREFYTQLKKTLQTSKKKKRN